MKSAPTRPCPKCNKPDALPSWRAALGHACAECQIEAMKEEGEMLRKEVERRVAPMKRGPFEPPRDK